MWAFTHIARNLLTSLFKKAPREEISMSRRILKH